MNNNYIEVVNKKKQQENKLVLRPIKKWLEKNLPSNEYVFYKNWGGGFNKAGRPDIEITYKGKVNYWELKDKEGELSTLQKEVIKSYANAGKIVYIVTSLEEFLETWNNIYKNNI